MKLILFFATLCIFANATEEIYKGTENNSEKVQYLWSKHVSEELEPIDFYTIFSEVNLTELNKIERLRTQEMVNSFETSKSTTRSPKRIDQKLSFAQAISLASEMQYFSNTNLVFSDENLKLIKKAEAYLEKIAKPKNYSKQSLKDLVFETPDYAHYKNGEYLNSLKVFMFCRSNRKYPCRLIFKDIFDNLVRNEDGSLWSLPTLALSKRGLPYNITNGSTPTGVHFINSVMPETNNQGAFGKFRRMILDWIPNSPNEKNMSHFLPESSLDQLWWKQASVARDNGRKFLRIHGTGRVNNDKKSSYYPHIPTSGCISTREGQYEETTYKDQRLLLDIFMEAMRLAPVFSNETSIKGVLYVLNIDEKKEAVTLNDLEKFDIK